MKGTENVKTQMNNGKNAAANKLSSKLSMTKHTLINNLKMKNSSTNLSTIFFLFVENVLESSSQYLRAIKSIISILNFYILFYQILKKNRTNIA